jgi:hypothetical protein
VTPPRTTASRRLSSCCSNLVFNVADPQAIVQMAGVLVLAAGVYAAMVDFDFLTVTWGYVRAAD